MAVAFPAWLLLLHRHRAHLPLRGLRCGAGIQLQVLRRDHHTQLLHLWGVPQVSSSEMIQLLCFYIFTSFYPHGCITLVEP